MIEKWEGRAGNENGLRLALQQVHWRYGKTRGKDVLRSLVVLLPPDDKRFNGNWQTSTESALQSFTTQCGNVQKPFEGIDRKLNNLTLKITA